MKIVIDSSILIDYLRGGIKWQEFLESAPQNAELFLPTIVIFELFSGKSAKKAQVATAILALLQQFTPIELTAAISQRAGELYKGSHIDAVDYIIAATALELHASVLTLNTKHFQQITSLNLYPLP